MINPSPYLPATRALFGPRKRPGSIRSMSAIHFHPWTERGQACFVWTWLGAAAAKTNRIILGTGVTCPIEVTLRPRTALASMRVHGPWQIDAIGFPAATNSLTNATAGGFQRSWSGFMTPLKRWNRRFASSRENQALFIESDRHYPEIFGSGLVGQYPSVVQG